MGVMKDIAIQRENICYFCSGRYDNRKCKGCQIHLSVRGSRVVLNGETGEVMSSGK